MVASVSIGIAVDDTIHFICGFQAASKSFGGDSMRAVEKTLKEVTPSFVATSFILCVGFGILCFSSFVPTQLFGILVLFTLFTALLAALLFLPALLLLTYPLKKEAHDASKHSDSSVIY
jgi:predicted RND superfamily exporter protein